MSIEAFLLENFLMDVALLLAASGAKRFRGRRAMLAGAVGAVAAAGLRAAGLDSFYWALALLPAMARISGLARSAREVPAASGRLAVGVIFMAGAQIASERAIPFSPVLGEAVGAAVGCGMLRALLIAREKRRDVWQVGLSVTRSGAVARFPALIDTGNRLREPMSGLPVVIVEESLVRDLLPEGYLENAESGRYPAAFRRVGYGALGGNGCLGCFLPDSVTFLDGADAPDAWVAVYPGKIPGTVRALAPAAYAREAAHTTNGGRKWRQRQDSHYSALS